MLNVTVGMAVLATAEGARARPSRAAGPVGEAVFVLEATRAVPIRLAPVTLPERRLVESTGYCLTGPTASGAPAGPGVVAMNGVPLGSRWRVVDGPLAGATLAALDRIGSGSEFDVWFPSCAAARLYGRRVIAVEPGEGAR